MELTTEEISEALNVPIPTLRGWNKKYNVPVLRTTSGLRYDDAAKEAIELIKSLREQKRGYETITRKLGEISKSSQNDSGMDGPEVQPLSNDFGIKLESLRDDLTMQFESNLEEKITQSHTVLAEQIGRQVELFNQQTEQGFEKFAQLLDEKSDFTHKIAMVAHQNGQLQAEVNFLRRQLSESENKVKLLPSVIEYNDAQRELDFERERRTSLESELIEMQEKLKAEQKLSWWDKLIGKKPKPPD